MANFKTDMSIEEILEIMDRSQGITETIHAGPCFLQYKLQEILLEKQQKQHKDILDTQNKYNRKQLSGTRNLVIATWVLALATILLALASFAG